MKNKPSKMASAGQKIAKHFIFLSTSEKDGWWAFNDCIIQEDNRADAEMRAKYSHEDLQKMIDRAIRTAVNARDKKWREAIEQSRVVTDDETAFAKRVLANMKETTK